MATDHEPLISETAPTDEPEGENLRQHWRAFDIALNNTPDFNYIFDLEGRFTYVNRALLRLWRKSLEEAIGKNFFDLDYPTALAERLQRQIQQVIDKKGPIRDHTPFTGPDGETRHYEYIFVPVLGDDGAASAVVGCTRDVTEQRQAEEERAKSDERLMFALEAGGGVGTWDWDIGTDRVYCNARFATLFGLGVPNLAAGLPIAAFLESIHPLDRERVTAEINHATRTGEEYFSEYRVRQSDGSERWVLARGRCHADGSGGPSRFPGIAFDITQRKQSEDALFESEQQFRTLAESIPNLAWMAHADGNIFWYNRRWYEYTGKTLQEMKGWGWQSVHDPAMLPQVVAKWSASIASGESFDMIFPLRRADGVMRSFLTRVEPVKDSKDKVVRWFGTNTDITEQRAIEAELRKKNRELEEFAYVASHDLQEPLRMVNIYTQLILKRCDGGDPVLKQYAGFVHGGVERMSALLQDLLTFSRTVHTDDEPVGTADLSQALEGALAVLKSRIEETGATIIAPPLPSVRGESDQLLHVFQNILSNALKYRKKNVAPVIRLSAQRRDEFWVISVKDNGIGFDPQYGQLIFGLFKRLHSDAYEGTGLGLAICRRIIERYGGEIWADSKLGKGSTFHFRLLGA